MQILTSTEEIGTSFLVSPPIPAFDFVKLRGSCFGHGVRFGNASFRGQFRQCSMVVGAILGGGFTVDVVVAVAWFPPLLEHPATSSIKANSWSAYDRLVTTQV